MTSRAFILVEASADKAPNVAKTLRGVSGVETTDLVTGSCDLIVVINAPDLSAIADLVVRRIYTIDGIDRITTCLAITSGRST